MLAVTGRVLRDLELNPEETKTKLFKSTPCKTISVLSQVERREALLGTED